MRIIVMDGNKIDSRREAHAFLKKGLLFPDYYGSNLDALYDCLCEIAEKTHIVLCHYDELEKNLGVYAAKLLRVITNAARNNAALSVSVIPPQASGCC
ncbi:MAG: barstar family protein [Thermoclostridium sp.]|nr:barstar family protein [Thermoclostridium sp.]